jgi:hypothetical protein
MSDIHKITLELRKPKGSFPGETLDGWYVVVENNVILTDQKGQPIGEKRHLNPVVTQGLSLARCCDNARGRAKAIAYQASTARSVIRNLAFVSLRGTQGPRLRPAWLASLRSDHRKQRAALPPWCVAHRLLRRVMSSAQLSPTWRGWRGGSPHPGSPRFLRSVVTLAPVVCATATLRCDAHKSRAAFFSAA